MKHIIDLFTLLLLVSTLLYGQGESYYYKYTETQPLDRDDQTVTVRFQEDTDLESLAGTLESAGLVYESRAEVGIDLFKFVLQEGMSIEEVLHVLRELEEVTAAHPLYRFYQTEDEVYLTDEICVQFLPEANGEEIEQIIGNYSLTVRRVLDVEPYYLFAVQRTADALEIANAIAQEGSVLFSHPNFYTAALVRSYTPTDRWFDRQWNFYNHGQQTRRGTGTAGADIKMLQAWDFTRGSSSVQVTVIDDGLDLNHEDIFSYKIVAGYDFADHDNSVQPVGTNAHGTHCSGLIAADHNTIGIAGISPNSKLQMMKIFRDNGYGGSNDDVARAIDSARTQGADVMSNSWGFQGYADTNLVPAIRQAILRAKNLGRNGKGCVVVFAASNTANRQYGNVGVISFPASMSQVITVAASTRNDFVAYYSPNSNPSANLFLDLAAPSHRAYSSQVSGEGFEIWSTDISGSAGYNPGTQDTMAGDPQGNYSGDFGGTSAACPQVAGASALILALDPNLTAEQVGNILNSTADTVGGYNYHAIQGRPGASLELGYGRLNVYRAMLAALPPQISFQFINRIQGTENYGTLVIDNDTLNAVASGSYRSFSTGTNHVVRTNELPFRPNWNGTGSTEKHHRFYIDSSDFSLNHQFSALPLTPQAQRAVFQGTSVATITSDLIDEGTSGGSIQLRDPWRYYRDQNGNWLQSNSYNSYGAPFVMNNNTVETYGGVFLGQSGPPFWSPPCYSVGAQATQSLSCTPGSLDWNFLKWRVLSGSATFQNANDDSTGVVFNQTNTTVAAQYKAYLASSVASATGSNSQRKLVDDLVLGAPYLCYESANAIWLSQFSGSTWGKETRVSDDVGAPSAFSYPSIASTGGLADDPEVDGPALYVVYKKFDGSNTSVWLKERRGTSWISPVQINTTAMSGDVAAKPVIARTNTQWQIGGQWTRPMLVALWETSDGVRRRTANGTTSGGWSWETNDQVLASSGYQNPSISSTYMHFSDDREFLYITYDNGNDVFMKPFGGNWGYSVEPVPASVSPTSWGSQVTANTYDPENHEVHVVWEAIGGEEQGTDGGDSWEDGIILQHKVMYQPNISGTWQAAHEFKSGIPGIHYYRPTISAVSSGNRVWAWDDGASAYKAVYDGNEWNITEVYSTGIYPNLEQEGTTGQLGEVKFVSMGSGPPYRLQFSQETSSPLGPTALPEVRQGRRVEAVRMSTNEEPNKFVSLEISGLNLVMSNGQRVQVGFVQTGDSLLNENNAWSRLATLPVTLTNAVDSVYLDGNVQTSSLLDLIENGQFLRLWIDLVDARTGDVIRRIGTQRSFDRDTTHFFHFRERLLGLTGREVFIRPSLAGFARRLENVRFTLVHVHSVYRDTTETPQSPLARMVGSEQMPTVFKLHQNFPNPFNPTTEIKFDLPEAGNVSLAVYDVLGKKVADLVEGFYTAGYHVARWDALGHASGVYFARFTMTNAEGRMAFTKVNKLVLMK